MVEMALVPQGTDDLLRLFDNALFSGGSPSLPTTPKSSRPSTTRVKKPRFLYNYIDFNTGFVATDMSDIRVDDALKYVKIMTRCILPVSQINGLNACDAGFKGNQYGTNVLYRYNPRRLTLITIKNAYQYATYPPISRLQMFLQRSRERRDPTGDISAVLIADPDVTPHKMRLCTISNGLFPSSDPHHRGLFYDYSGFPNTSFGMSWFYITPYSACKVLQNEGYIQMCDELGNRRGRSVPNRDVHNADVRSLLLRHGYMDSRT